MKVISCVYPCTSVLDRRDANSLSQEGRGGYTVIHNMICKNVCTQAQGAEVRLTSGSRMQPTFHAIRRTSHGAARMVHAISAWAVKTGRAPSRHCRDARVYSHRTTAMPEKDLRMNQGDERGNNSGWFRLSFTIHPFFIGLVNWI